MNFQSQEEKLGKHLPTGANHYRAYIGPPERYDLVSANQFSLLTLLGLREEHYLLDIGCGSLRGGKLFIPYLLPEHYFGIEPEQWLIEAGIANEISAEQIALKKPTFSNDRNFTLSVFNRHFDFILAQSIFSHASAAQMRRCLSEARKVMHQESVFVANFGKGETNYSGDEWVYPGGVNYTLEFMISLAAEHGFACQQLAWPQPNGLTWIAITYPGQQQRVSALVDDAPFLRNELARYKQRLVTVEGHPYVKLGMAINRLIRRLRQGKTE